MLAAILAAAAACPDLPPVQANQFLQEHAQAARVAYAIHPEPTMRSFNLRAATDSLRKYLATDPVAKQLDEAAPGFSALLLSRTPEVLGGLLDVRLPSLYACVAKRIDDQMSDQELKKALAFLESPEGGRIQQEITDGNVRLYLEKGPLTAADVKAIKEAPSKEVPASPERTAATRAATIFENIISGWTPSQHEAEQERLKVLTDQLISEMEAGQTS